MAVEVNKKGVSHAKSLIRQGKVDKESSWEFTADDGNKILGDGDWAEYSKWFLAIDTEANEETKERYKFPYGKNGKVYRRAVIAAKQRAAQNGYSNIEEVADDLLSMIDKDKEEKIIEGVVNRKLTREYEFRAENVDDEKKIVRLSFSSEEPVMRWYGKEILVHGDGVNLKPFLDCGSVLRNHDPDKPVAVPVTAWIDKDQKKGRAIIKFVDTPESLKAYEEVKNGLIRGVSVGYIIREYERVQEGEKYNGIEGPALLATRWDVIEVSITPVPADITVGIGRKIEEKEEEKMEEILQKELKAERQRISEILTICREFEVEEDEIQRFIDEGKTVDEVRNTVLEKLKNERKQLGLKVVADETDRFRKAAIEGILLRCGEKAERQDGMEHFARKSLLDLAEICLERVGVKTGHLSKMEIAKRAIIHSTSDFPYILEATVQKVLRKAYDEYPSTYQLWTTKVSVSDFKTYSAVNHGGFGTLSLKPESAEYRLITFSDTRETFGIATYGAMHDITREQIINDDLNVFSTIPKKLGQAAKRTIETVVYSILVNNPVMGDGIALFHSSHGNLGSAGSISATTLSEVRKRMAEQRDPSGIILGLKPKYMIVPPALYATAQEWMTSTIYPSTSGSSKTGGQPNVWRGFAEVIETPYIGAVVGGSDTHYFFVADPDMIDGVWVAFLDGNEEPRVEKEETFEVDGIRFKVAIDFGAKAIDYRALFKNAGA